MLLAGCSFSGDRTEATPTGTPPPATPAWTEDLRYQPAEEELCERIRWEKIGSDLDVTIGEVSADDRGISPLSWGVTCQMDNFSIGAVDLGVGFIDLAYEVFEEPEQADYHYNLVAGGQVDRLDLDTEVEAEVVDLDGWWDQATGIERAWERGIQGENQSSVIWYVHHANAYLTVGAVGVFAEAPDVAKVREVVRAVIEEARIHLPCEPLVSSPVAGCG